MKKAMVLGASGGMGYALVKELAAQGVETIAFARTKSKLEALFGTCKNIHIAQGDARLLANIIEAGSGVDVIFHTINIPYSQWTAGHPMIMENVLSATEKLGAKLVMVDNIYAYGRGSEQAIGEEYPKQPHTRKGKFRLTLENMIWKANQTGVPSLVAHFPDFYGPHAPNTVLHYTFHSMLQGKRAMFVGGQEIKREYIFTPDGAKALIELAKREDAYGQHWNIPGYGVITGKEIIAIAREFTEFTGKVGTVGKGMITLLGLFNKDMREIKELMYLMEEPVVLSGSKYEAHIGPLPKTPYKEGIRQTIACMKGA
ncbi:SDR family NAD(P)-dependent oxidoreductase [Aneurinibacillus sp. REN35]|uniref:SDR family NAD(P)-dependent oxidoreductase n=1 Tax=Aneurinibacillus sp. REN35 TaxID=3237286 RepID=UPI003527A0A7